MSVVNGALCGQWRHKTQDGRSQNMGMTSEVRRRVTYGGHVAGESMTSDDLTVRLVIFDLAMSVA